MITEELITDLKQFITATVSQATADLATKQDLADLRQELRGEIADLRTDMDQRFDEVLDAVGERLDDHELRLTKLERRASAA